MIRLSLALRFKLGAAFSVIIVLLMGVFSVYYLHSLNDEVQTSLQSDLNLLRIVERIGFAMDMSQAHVLLTMQPAVEAASGPFIIQEFRQAEQELRERLQSQGPLNASTTFLVADLQDYARALSRTELATPGERLPLVIDLFERHRSLMVRLDQLDNNRRETVAHHLQTLAAATKSAQGKMALFAIITIALAIGLSIFFSQQITLPVRRLKELIGRIRDGDYDISARPQPEDEIGQIFNCLVRASENIAIRDRLKLEKIEIERRRFATLANHLPMPLLVVNGKNQIAHANNGALDLFRVAYDDLFEMDVARAPIPPKLKEHLTTELKKGGYPIDQKIVCAVEPKELAVSLTVIPVENTRGEVISIICLLPVD